MRKVLLLTALIAIQASISYAQDKSRPELFGGYSFENIDSGIKSRDFAGTGIPTTTLENRFKLNGFNISGTGYLTKRLGLTGDFSAGFQTRTDDFGVAQARSRLTLYNFTGGPQVKFFSAGRATPFAHALFGVSRRRLKEEATGEGMTSITSAIDSTTNLTMNLGGGLDVRLNDRFDFRLVQVDYNPVFLKNRTIARVNFPGRTANGLRISVGLVIK
jgi:opacity protein-like surface antigen